MIWDTPIYPHLRKTPNGYIGTWTWSYLNAWQEPVKTVSGQAASNIYGQQQNMILYPKILTTTTQQLIYIPIPL